MGRPKNLLMEAKWVTHHLATEPDEHNSVSDMPITLLHNRALTSCPKHQPPCQNWHIILSTFCLTY